MSAEPAVLETITGKRFDGARILLGRANYIDCEFWGCDLIFDGQPLRCTGCNFGTSTVMFEGAAVESLLFFHQLATGDGWSTMDEAVRHFTGAGGMRFLPPD